MTARINSPPLAPTLGSGLPAFDQDPDAEATERRLAEDLNRAIRWGDLPSILRALAAGADPEKVTADGDEDSLCLALSLPVAAARHACARALMRACAPKPVHLSRAAESGDPVMLASAFDWLVAHLGPALDWIHQAAPPRPSPLMAAVSSRSLDCVALLLSWGSDPRRADDFGSTPLTLASRSGIFEIVELLAPLSDLDAFDRHGVTALMRAVDGHPHCARFLLPLCDPRPRDHSGRDALEQACWEQPASTDVALGLCQALHALVPRLEWIARVARASGLAEGCGNRLLSAELRSLVATELELAQLDAVTAHAASSEPHRL